jgi:hypothetical protein
MESGAGAPDALSASVIRAAIAWLTVTTVADASSSR